MDFIIYQLLDEKIIPKSRNLKKTKRFIIPHHFWGPKPQGSQAVLAQVAAKAVVILRSPGLETLLRSLLRWL